MAADVDLATVWVTAPAGKKKVIRVPTGALILEGLKMNWPLG